MSQIMGLQVPRSLFEPKNTDLAKTGSWIDEQENGFVECPFCKAATNCDNNIDELHYCFSCGARLIPPGGAFGVSEKTE